MKSRSKIRISKEEKIARTIFQVVQIACDSIPEVQRSSFSKIYVTAKVEENWIRIKTMVETKSKDIYPQEWDYSNFTPVRDESDLKLLKKKKIHIMDMVMQMAEQADILNWEEVDGNEEVWVFIKKYPREKK